VNRVRKIGEWIWRNKERMVLAIMVCFLGFRVYQVVSPVDEESGRMPQPPSSTPTDDVELPGVPGPPPPPPPAEDYSLLWRINPFGGWRASGRGGTETQASEDLEISLLRIREVAPGQIRAQIQTPGRRGWYEEGDAFEAYELLSIDPDADTVVVFSERLERQVELRAEN